MPNTFAYIILFLWPIISIYFYKRFSTIKATFLTVVGGFLILPVRVDIDLPLIPPLDKNSIPIIFALIGCMYVKKIKIKLLPKKGIEKILILVLLVSPLITVLNNQESLRFIPGLSLHDAISIIINQYLRVLPFILGMQLIKTHDDQMALLKLLVSACLLYSILALYEIRMSPQLHTNLYGFFPHSFLQQRREGGFRAVVFLGHGLIVSMFIAVSLGAATILYKEKIKSLRLSPVLVVIFLFGILLLNKTISGLILGTILFTLIAWAPLPVIRKSAMVIILLVLMYPTLSLVNYFPHEALVQLATDYDPGRGESLGYRFKNEHELLEHAKNKLYFGWGSWGRNRLEDSVTDGYWIIMLGQFGLFGFGSLMGLLAVSVWKAIKASHLQKDKTKQRIMLGYALMIAVIMIDQLPNASLGPWLWFLAGGLAGRADHIKFSEKNNFSLKDEKKVTYAK